MNNLRLNTLLFLFSVFAVEYAVGQTNFVRVSGHLKDETTRETLVQGDIQVLNGDLIFIEQAMGKMGAYTFDLDLGAVYDVVFSSQGHLSKIIRFDTRNISEESSTGGFDVRVDGSLIPKMEGFNLDLLKEPVAICAFNAATDGLEFDRAYSMKRQEEIEKEMSRAKGVIEEQGK